MLLAHTLAAQSTAEGTGILCTILLIATVIAFIIGLTEAIGLTRFTGTGNGRFSTLLIAIVLLVVYLIVC